MAGHVVSRSTSSRVGPATGRGVPSWNDDTGNVDDQRDDTPPPCMLLPGHLADGATVGAPAGEAVVELRLLGQALALADPRSLFNRHVREGLLIKGVHYFEQARK